MTVGLLLIGASQTSRAQARPTGAAAAFRPRQLSPFDRQKAESLLKTRYPCLGCHELAGTGGHIGPALDGVGVRRAPVYLYSMISDPQGTVGGTIMPRVPMPAKTLELIASFLIQGGSAPPAKAPSGKTIPAPGPATPGDIKALYARSCAACHGAEGRGDGPNAAYLPARPTAHASADAMARRSDDALFDTIFSGGYIMNRSNFMPPFGGTLSLDEIRGLVGYIRTLCRCMGPAWSRDPEVR